MLKCKYCWVSLIFIVFFSCNYYVKDEKTVMSENHSEIEAETCKASSLKMELSKYQIIFKYDSIDEIQIDNINFKNFIYWLEKVKKIFFSDVAEKNNVIFDIETVINNNISENIAKHRIGDIIEIINNTIGTDAEDLPIARNINYLKWGNINDNYIKITLNQLIM